MTLIIPGLRFLSAAAQEKSAAKQCRAGKAAGLCLVWHQSGCGPSDNVIVRRAVQHAVDRQSVVDAAYFGAASVGTDHAPGMPGSRSGVTGDYDPDKARDIQEGISSLNVTLDILNQSERLTAAQVIQANPEVGINVEIKQNDSGTFWTLGSMMVTTGTNCSWCWPLFDAA